MANLSYSKSAYPLHDAAELGSLADVEVLISIGKIPINLQNPAGKTPLMLAAQERWLKSYYLLEQRLIM
ncbi:MAG: ankyrin repeat domain-containing protein [Gammaproteobacteria bacterium]|nr:ankyrin repeat domain-containing protein [Gammaproteobacteria bacterium]